MKHIIIDAKNILFHIDTDNFKKSLSYQTSININDVNRRLNKIYNLYNLGYTTIKDELIDSFNIKAPIYIDKLMLDWKSSIVPNETVLNFFKKLQINYNIKIALISNIGHDQVSLIKDYLHNNLNIDCTYFSSEIGIQKPSPTYYQSFLNYYPDFKGSLYIDNNLKNLNISKNFGFSTIYFSLKDPNYEEKIKDIENLVIY